MKSNLKNIIVAAGVLSATTSAHAIDREKLEFNTGFNLYLSDTDDSDLSGAAGFKIFQGIRFFKYAGVEVAFAQPGTYKYTPTNIDIEIDQQIEVAVIGYWPSGSGTMPYVKLGNAAWSATAQDRATSEKTDDSGGAPFLGIGVKIGNEKIGFDFEYLRYNYDIEELGLETGVNAITMGFEWRY